MNNRMRQKIKKKSRLLLAQIDHLTGETLGFAVERLMESGAHNVQIIPAITKKNRPSSLLLIDTDESKEKAIADFLVRELKVLGYHRVETSHIFQRTTFIKKRFAIKLNGKISYFECDIKIAGDPSHPVSVDVEHSTLVKVQKNIKEKSAIFISLSELQSIILSKLGWTAR